MSYDYTPRLPSGNSLQEFQRWTYDELLKISSNLIYQRFNDAVADAAAISAYSAHAAGGVTVTSNAATDLDTVAAALETLRDEVAANRVTLNEILASLRNGRVLDT